MSKTLATLILLGILAAPALPSRAAPDECVDIHITPPTHLTFDHGDRINAGQIRASIVGSYIWVQWGHEHDPDGGATDTLSWEWQNSGLTRLTACLDGAVLLDYSHIEDTPPDTPALDLTTVPPRQAPVDPVFYCARYSNLERVCTLPNLTVTIL